MADKELGKLSPEQVQKLANTISEAKDLTSQQEEIIQRVLAGEVEISNARIAALDQYFDIYSKQLDKIARKYSELDDTFLLLGHKLNSNYKALYSDITDLVHRLDSTSESNNKTQGSVNKQSDRKTATDFKAIVESALDTLTKTYKKDLASITNKTLAIDDQQSRLIQNYQERRYEQIKQQLEQLASKATNASESASAPLIKSDSNNPAVEPVIRANIREGDQEIKTAPALGPDIVDPSNVTRKELVQLFNDIAAEEKTHAKILKAIQAGRIKDENDAWASYYDTLAATREAFATQQIGREESLNSKLAEIDAKKYADNLRATFEANKTKKAQTELGRARADEVNAQERLKSIQELESNMAERRRELEAEARAQHGGKLLKKDATSIEKQLNDEFSTQFTDKNINAITKKRFENENRDRQIEALKNTDPSVATVVDKQLAKEQAALEKQYRLEHNIELNKELNAQVLEDIKNQAKEKVLREKASIKQLAEAYKELNGLKEANPAAAQALEARRIKLIADEEYKQRKALGRLLTADERAAINETVTERYEKEFELSEANIKKLHAIQLRDDEKRKRAAVAATNQEINNAISGPLTKENNLIERFKDLKEIADRVDDSDDNTNAELAVAIKAMSGILVKLENTVDSIGSYKGDIDTRLQGSNNKTVLGSYWDQLNRDMMSVGAVTPFFKQEDFANNIKALVERGISFDLKQRAFLMTIQEKIANTFDVADGTLLRLIRIQQEDSTAGRLGMESALNSFLNNMYETSEYLSDVAKQVRSSLEEMESLMSGAEAAEVEFQVQKWMGSLYSVGMSSEAVNNIAATLGQIAAGQVEALTNNSGAGNLMVMAANEAGLAISDILIKGLDAQETNNLLQATVNYLAELAESSKDNRVVQQQLANVFGVKASDLKAATNLATNNTTAEVFSTYKTYDNMLKQLNNMAGSMVARTSIGEMMTNVWDNGMFTLASSMSNNPISYLTYKMSSLLEKTTGGIALPFISAAGFGVDLETTVADLMRVASLSTGIIGSLGSIISGLGSSFDGRAMLNKMGIESGSGLAITPRGTVSSLSATSGQGAKTTSSSGYVGNAKTSDIKNSTLQSAEDSKDQLMIEAQEEASATQIDSINANVLKIYELLEDVASGKRNLNVKVSNYGLTSSSLSGAQGGTAGLLNNSNSVNNNALSGGLSDPVSSGSSISSSSTGTGYGINTGLDLGGWTMI